MIAKHFPARLTLISGLLAIALTGCQSTTSPTTGSPGVSYGDAKG